MSMIVIGARDSRFMFLELLLDLSIRVHLHVRRMAVTACFLEIIYWKEDAKLQRLNAFQ